MSNPNKCDRNFCCNCAEIKDTHNHHPTKKAKCTAYKKLIDVAKIRNHHLLQDIIPTINKNECSLLWEKIPPPADADTTDDERSRQQITMTSDNEINKIIQGQDNTQLQNAMKI